MAEFDVLEVVVTKTEIYAFVRETSKGKEELYITFVDQDGLRQKHLYSDDLFRKLLDETIKQVGAKPTLRERFLDISNFG